MAYINSLPFPTSLFLYKAVEQLKNVIVFTHFQQCKLYAEVTDESMHRLQQASESLLSVLEARNLYSC